MHTGLEGATASTNVIQSVTTNLGSVFPRWTPSINKRRLSALLIVAFRRAAPPWLCEPEDTTVSALSLVCLRESWRGDGVGMREKVKPVKVSHAWGGPGCNL